MEAQREPRLPDQSPTLSVITSYHENRYLLLQSLQIILQEAVNGTDDEGPQAQFQAVVSEILEVRTGPASNGSAYTRKCLSILEEVEKWQTKVADHIQAASVMGQPRDHEITALLDFQRLSLSRQHEALGAILALLFKGNYTISEDLRKLLQVPKRWDRLDISLIHYLPAFSTAFAQYGSPEHSSSLQEARSLHTAIVAQNTQTNAHMLQPFQAVLTIWWLAEYSGWYKEPNTSISVQGTDLTRETEDRARVANQALNDNALEFLLAICSNMTIDEWHHPARQELVNLLLEESSGLAVDVDLTSEYFRTLFMESLESFAESWITNMPDTIRQLKSEEDDRRLQHITDMQNGMNPALKRDRDTPLHLECFLVIISYAFEHRLEAAEEFWADPDSNLFGFLQWASRRQTVPRVSAFCEMLCAISEGPDCANSSHKFLLDESAATSSRTRRTPSMNYVQMFNELELYAYKIYERPASSQLPQVRKVLPTDMNELESPVMLSCYLRLIAHMCRESETARNFVLETTTIDFVQTLLILSAGPIPSYLRASLFATLEALMTQKISDSGNRLWTILDQWASLGPASLAPSLTKFSHNTLPPSQTIQHTLTALTVSFEQYDAFVFLLKALICPATDTPVPTTSLPFPEDLGSSYRTPGISPYIDLVCGQLFAKKLNDLPDEKQTRILRFHCLDLIAVCLETFNESFVAVVDRNASEATSKEAVSASAAYGQRHPFARTMEWLFTADVSKNLMLSTHQSTDEVSSSAPDSVLIISLLRSLDILNLIFDLQPTYLDIVRPLVKTTDRSPLKTMSAIASFEDSIVSNPDIIADLRLYAATSHDQLVLRSLALLQKLSSSRKLNNPAYTIGSSHTKSRRIIDMLGPNSSSDTISLALASKMQIDIRELEGGPESPGYIIKDGILAFLNSCLAAQSDLPNMAHLLLGFAKTGESLLIEEDSPLQNGLSLLNAVVRLVQDYPDGESDTFISWLIHAKTAGFQVLRQLWASPLSSVLTLVELRNYHFLASQFAKQAIVSPGTLWDGYPIAAPSFWVSKSADALAEFLSSRAFLFEYAATELRSVAHSRLTSMQNQILSVFLGRTPDISNEQASRVTVFDLFDFTNLDIGGKFDMPELKSFASIDMETCASQASDDSTMFYDLDAVRELLQLRMVQILKTEQAKQSNEEEQMLAEAGSILAYLEATNRWSLVQTARGQTLRMWVELIIATLEYCPMDHAAKIQFSLHALQLILPKLDAMMIEETENAVELARLADALIFALTVSTSVRAKRDTGNTTLDRTTSMPTQAQSRASNMIVDRLFYLFRTCISGIHAPNTSPALREILYAICSRYLTYVAEKSQLSPKAQRNAMDCIRSAGVPLMSTLSDDAEDGVDTSRMSALSMLGLLTALARSEKSSYIVDTLVKANMLEVLIEPVKHIAADFQQTEPKGKYMNTPL